MTEKKNLQGRGRLLSVNSFFDDGVRQEAHKRRRGISDLRFYGGIGDAAHLEKQMPRIGKFSLK